MITLLCFIGWLLLIALFVCRRLMAAELRERREPDEHPH